PARRHGCPGAEPGPRAAGRAGGPPSPADPGRAAAPGAARRSPAPAGAPADGAGLGEGGAGGGAARGAAGAAGRAAAGGGGAGGVWAGERIQKGLPADAALLAWVDLEPTAGSADPAGDHWACVVRRRGKPAWVKLRGSGPRGAWTRGDEDLPGRLR